MTATKASRERQILAVSAELFAAHGFAAVGIDEIGEAVGITGPAVYRYFRGKDAILEELVTSTTQAMVENLAVFGEDDGDDPETMLRRTATIALEHRAALATTFREARRLRPEVTKQLAGPLRRLEALRHRAIDRFNPDLSDDSRRLRLAATSGVLNVVMTCETTLPHTDLIERLLASNVAIFTAPAVEWPAAPPAPGWTPRSERRDLMLEAALRLMGERGYHDVGVDEIAAAADVPTRALYRHYVNKLDILVAAFERADRRIAAVREIALIHGRTAAEVSRELASELPRAALRDVDLALVTFRERKALSRSETRDRFHAMQELQDTWVAALADTRPELSGPESELMVEMAIALVHHAAADARDHPACSAELTAITKAHLGS